MALIESISGIRGTIGGNSGKGLTPTDIVRFTAAYASIILEHNPSHKIVIGRDARISGAMVSHLVTGTLLGMGCDVIDAGLSTTPTVEMLVTETGAAGGIIITASHNPRQWNALKLLNDKGEFISSEWGETVKKRALDNKFDFAEVTKLGTYTSYTDALQQHIDKILALPLVDVEAIKKKNFTVVVDAVNSSGGIAVPMLLEALGVKTIHKVHCEPTGHFAHNPEPLPENLSDLSNEVKLHKADVGIAVDPDVDRLALVCEDGSMFGEEYTLVAVADYVLQHKKGNTVSNLSSTQALRDITVKHGGAYYASAVGEVNVVEKMREVNAVIGGEGNGGIIVPDLHYGRDALAGIALFLSHLAKSKKACSVLRSMYPSYIIVKEKIELGDTPAKPKDVLNYIKKKYAKQPVSTVDGVRLEFDNDWIHIRTSNTEPIMRIYAESQHETTARNLVKKIISDIKEFLSNKE